MGGVGSVDGGRISASGGAGGDGSGADGVGDGVGDGTGGGGIDAARPPDHHSKSER